MKSYTDINQSKKLAEILPLESADMFYDGVQDLYKEKVYNIPINGSSITVRTGHIITEKGIKANLLLPAWSLTALLGVLPEPNLIEKDGLWHLFCDDADHFSSSTGYDNPIDACVAMIERLHELNLL